MTHVFHRHTRDVLPVAAYGDGIRIYDTEGRAYIDASGGAAVSCLGHSHPKVIAAIEEQLDRIAFAHTTFFTNPAMEELADRLVAAATEELPDARLQRVHFVSGGSEAVEAALKLARQYFWERGEPERRHVVARRHSYHGTTLGALGASGNIARRAPFEAFMSASFRHIAPCYAYRDRRSDETDEAYGRRVADELETAILDLGPETVAAFICEPVVGSSLGAVPPVPGYLARLREICDRYGVLLIFDEVMCGMGRTGHLFACAEDGVAPDLLTIAKGLGAGYQPIGAVLVAEAVHDAIRDGSGFFQHGHTYMGHPLACAAALAVQRTLAEEGLLEEVGARGRYLQSALEGRFGDHPHVGDIRGRGLFRALELVTDRATGNPFPTELALHARVRRAAMDRGLICYPMGGTADGSASDHILLAPPFIVGDADLDEIVDRLGAAIDAALATTGVEAVEA